MNIIDNRTPYNRAQWQGLNNTHQFIAIHYLGVDGQNFNLYNNGYGGHYTIGWNGDIYWSADHNAVLWQVGTAGYYTKKFPNGWDPTNYNTVGIEMCCHFTDGHWWFTEETQIACVELVQFLLKELNLDSSHVLRHYDIVNKTCPAPYVTNDKYKTNWTWDEFLAKVKSNSENSYSFRVAQLQKGSRNSSVKLLQKLLNIEFPNETIKVDGDFGNNTLNLLLKYQKKAKLDADGSCGPKTWFSLLNLFHSNLVFTANFVKKGSKKSEVLLLQKLLKLEDLYKGNLDSDFGEQTAVALKDFQTKNQLESSGICDSYTWKTILKL